MAGRLRSEINTPSEALSGSLSDFHGVILIPWVTPTESSLCWAVKACAPRVCHVAASLRSAAMSSPLPPLPTIADAPLASSTASSLPSSAPE